MVEQLKPCPFCGGEASSGFHQESNLYSASCDNFSCPSKKFSTTREKAIAAWNTRTESAEPHAAKEEIKHIQIQHDEWKLLAYDRKLELTTARAEIERLRSHIIEMQRLSAMFLEPTTYVKKFPEDSSAFHSVFDMPEPLHSEEAKRTISKRRDDAFISDIIRMLDGPEVRAVMEGKP